MSKKTRPEKTSFGKKCLIRHVLDRICKSILLVKAQSENRFHAHKKYPFVSDVWFKLFLSMSNEENHGHQRKRLRAACKAATQRRGLNAGHVVCVVDTLQQHGLLEECVSKKQLRNDLQKHRVNWSAETTFALTLPLENGENFTWHVATPHSILQHFVSSVPNMESLFKHCLPGKPLQMILYHDECTPGNILAPDPSRKCCCFYISSLDWMHALRSEFAWFPIGILRSSIIRQVPGGLSDIVKRLLQSWDAGRQGLPIHFPKKGIQIISLQLSACVMDEAGMRDMWQFKGASGRKPCGLCKNVVSKYVASQIDGTHFVGIDCSQINSCFLVTDDEVWEAHDHLASIHGIVTKKQFENMQSNLGINYNAVGLLSDASLRQWVFPTTACYDVLHCFFSNGLVAVEFGLFLKLLRDNGLELDRLQAQLQFDCSSQHPLNPATRSKLLSIPFFSEKYVWKASGSEILNMLPLLHYWYILFVKDTDIAVSCAAACKCFERLCERIFFLAKLMATNHKAFCDLLENKQQEHHACFSTTYGFGAMKPKHHYALHIPRQWRKYGFVLDTKVTERKHQSIKREVMSSMQNLQNFEVRALERIVTCQELEMKQAGQDFWMTSLRNPSSSSNGVFQSVELRNFDGFIWKKGMPMLANDLTWCGIVQTFHQNGTSITCLVRLYDLSHKLATGIYSWTESRNEKALTWTANAVHCPYHWIKESTKLTTLW